MNLRDRYIPDLSSIQEDERADYRFRAVAPREAVASAMAQAVRDLNYPNVKNRIAEVQGDNRAIVLHGVWSALRRLQSPQMKADLPIMYASIGRRPDILDPNDEVPLRDDPSKPRN